jgi:hypothetical protein
MTSPMWYRMSNRSLGRRRIGWAFAAMTLVVSLAGCVSMQDSGPPGTLQATQSGTTQDAANIGFIPVQPKPGLTPTQLVSAFLTVSASYSTYPLIVKSYLTPDEAKAWNPQWSATVFSSFPEVTPLPTATVKGKPAAKVIVTVSGQVQATFSGSGQYLSVSQNSTQSSCAKDQPNSTCEQFTLVESSGQWRIAKLPSYLLLDGNDFSRVYQSQQDAYFFDPGFRRLVPDTVFVPLGTPPSQLLSTLVGTLIPPSGGTAAPGSASASQTWLAAGATATSIPPGTKLLGPVTINGQTATVDLGGAIAENGEQRVIPLVMAQLTWTLIGSPTGSPGSLPITAVDLYINNNQLTTTPQTDAQYSKYAPYPTSPGVFTYVDNGEALSLCGASLPNIASAGKPVFNANGVPELATCGGGASASPSASPSASTGQRTTGKSHPPGTTTANPMSMVAASPGDRYLAGVSTNLDTVRIWSLSAHSAAPVVKWSPSGQTINSVSWDRQNDLWIVTSDGSTQGTSIYMLSTVTGKVTLATFGGGNVLSLSVAPDGVRVALIVQTGPSTSQVELAAIERSPCASGAGCKWPGSVDVTLAQGPPLGSTSVTDATSLTWYDQDTLYVLDKSGPTSDLWNVPVTGRQPTGPDPVQVQSGSDQIASDVYAESITADSKENVLVAGMSNGELLFSAIFNQLWQPLGPGAVPAYAVNP